MGRPLSSALSSLLLALMLAACGGGDGGEANSNTSPQPSAVAPAQEPNAPQASNNTATDGFNWFNFRRQQAGMQQVLRNARVDAAAQGHSDYQRINNVITHQQVEGQPGFIGRTAGNRLTAAGYQFAPNASFAYGEVISASSDSSGFRAAEDLLAAIYHRFVILEPMFKEAGAGAATAASGTTYFTTNFVANGLDSGLGAGAVALYPFANQQRVPRNFFSDQEAPDPVPDRNEVGYPISVHANITSIISVQSFNVRPRGGAPLESVLLTRARDAQTPLSAAAIIPLRPLAAGTTYDVQFSGKVGDFDVVRNWSFMTQ